MAKEKDYGDLRGKYRRLFQKTLRERGPDDAMLYFRAIDHALHDVIFSDDRLRNYPQMWSKNNGRAA